MSENLALTDTLETIKEDTEGDKISVGDIVEALNSRGYGPLLIAPALITILPTGAIPGVPDISALLIILISVQILIGRSCPWIPSRLKDLSISRDKFLNTLDKAKVYTKAIDRYIQPRLTFLTRKEVQPVIAIICILLSIAIMILGFIPFMAALPATGILLLGLGLSGKDGLLLILSLALLIASFIAIPYLWSFIFG